MTRLLEALLRVTADLEDLGVRWALVGGLAVSVWVEPRTTRDIDLAIAVENDRQAERLIRNLKARGYILLPEHFEQAVTGRLATVRRGLRSMMRQEWKAEPDFIRAGRLSRSSMS